MTDIPMLDLTGEVEALWDELQESIAGVLRSGRFINGPNVREFEAEAAAFLGVEHCIGVNSGTDALVIALRALGVGHGDEVVTTPFTFFATAEAISMVGAMPVFADIDPATFNLDVEAAAAALTERTKAVIPVHLFGLACDMDAVAKLAADHGVAVLEDTAQAFGGTFRGTKLGTIGEAGAFSFFPSKNLGAYGDGGLVATDDGSVAETARKLRAHGSSRKYYNEMLGYNSRLDELQAAILRVKLGHLEAWNEGRQRVAACYRELLADVPGIVLPPGGDGQVYHQFTLRILDGRRDHVQSAMHKHGVDTMIYYPVPVNRLPVYAGTGVDNTPTPNSDAAAGEVLSLPIWPSMAEEVQARVHAALLRGLGS